MKSMRSVVLMVSFAALIGAACNNSNLLGRKSSASAGNNSGAQCTPVPSPTGTTCSNTGSGDESDDSGDCDQPDETPTATETPAPTATPAMFDGATPSPTTTETPDPTATPCDPNATACTDGDDDQGGNGDSCESGDDGDNNQTGDQGGDDGEGDASPTPTAAPVHAHVVHLVR